MTFDRASKHQARLRMRFTGEGFRDAKERLSLGRDVVPGLFSAEDEDLLRRMLFGDDGNLVVFTGLTASGKTSSMRAVLQSFTSAEENITACVVEDHDEFAGIPNVTHCQTSSSLEDKEASLTVEKYMEKLMSTDFDILALSEVRDFHDSVEFSGNEGEARFLRMAAGGRSCITSMFQNRLSSLINHVSLSAGLQMSGVVQHKRVLVGDKSYFMRAVVPFDDEVRETLFLEKDAEKAERILVEQGNLTIEWKLARLVEEGALDVAPKSATSPTSYSPPVTYDSFA